MMNFNSFSKNIIQNFTDYVKFCTTVIKYPLLMFFITIFLSISITLILVIYILPTYGLDSDSGLVIKSIIMISLNIFSFFRFKSINWKNEYLKFFFSKIMVKARCLLIFTSTIFGFLHIYIYNDIDIFKWFGFIIIIQHIIFIIYMYWATGKKPHLFITFIYLFVAFIFIKVIDNDHIIYILNNLIVYFSTFHVMPENSQSGHGLSKGESSKGGEGNSLDESVLGKKRVRELDTDNSSEANTSKRTRIPIASSLYNATQRPRSPIIDQASRIVARDNLPIIVRQENLVSNSGNSPLLPHSDLQLIRHPNTILGSSSNNPIILDSGTCSDITQPTTDRSMVVYPNQQLPLFSRPVTTMPAIFQPQPFLVRQEVISPPNNYQRNSYSLLVNPHYNGFIRIAKSPISTQTWENLKLMNVIPYYESRQFTIFYGKLINYAQLNLSHFLDTNTIHPGLVIEFPYGYAVKSDFIFNRSFVYNYNDCPEIRISLENYRRYIINGVVKRNRFSVGRSSFPTHLPYYKEIIDGRMIFEYRPFKLAVRLDPCFSRALSIYNMHYNLPLNSDSIPINWYGVYANLYTADKLGAHLSRLVLTEGPAYDINPNTGPNEFFNIENYPLEPSDILSYPYVSNQEYLLYDWLIKAMVDWDNSPAYQKKLWISEFRNKWVNYPDYLGLMDYVVAKKIYTQYTGLASPFYNMPAAFINNTPFNPITSIISKLPFPNSELLARLDAFYNRL